MDQWPVSSRCPLFTSAALLRCTKYRIMDGWISNHDMIYTWYKSIHVLLHTTITFLSDFYLLCQTKSKLHMSFFHLFHSIHLRRRLRDRDVGSDDLQTPTFTRTCEQWQTRAPLSQANNFSFERLLWEHLHRNIWEWQEIRHLSAWRAMNVFRHFRGMSRVCGAQQPPNPWQNLWRPAASGSHYPCHLPDKWLNWAHSCGAGPMFVFWHNYSYIVFSHYVHNIVPVVVNANTCMTRLERIDREGFSYHNRPPQCVHTFIIPLLLH